MNKFVITLLVITFLFGQRIIAQETNSNNWMMYHGMTGGLGLLRNGDSHNGEFCVTGEVIPLAFGFDALHGIGFGTKLYEVCPVVNGNENNSLLPLYAYYPLYLSEPQVGPVFFRPMRKSFLYLYSGASFWPTSNSLATEYFNSGIGWCYSYQADSGPSPTSPVYGTGSFMIKLGVLYYGRQYDQPNRTDIYLTLSWGVVGNVFQ
jgi:hypothetical protein